MNFPRNEAETIALFQLAQHRLDWRIVHLQIAFPDAIIENGQGKQLIVEFEYEAKNFRAHEHDPAGCDLIICYKDGWENPPVPVWALEGCTKEEVAIINKLIGNSVAYQTYFDLSMKCGRLEKENRNLRTQLDRGDKTVWNLWCALVHEASQIKHDWVTLFAFTCLGIGFWAIHPIILRLLGAL